MGEVVFPDLQCQNESRSRGALAYAEKRRKLKASDPCTIEGAFNPQEEWKNGDNIICGYNNPSDKMRKKEQTYFNEVQFIKKKSRKRVQ